MGKLTYIKSNLFNTTCSIIAHGVNCQGKFGAGIARQIAEKYPEVKESYLAKYKFDKWETGQCQFVMINHQLDKNPLWVVNLATQDKYGRNGIFIDYYATKKCLETLFTFCEDGKFSLAIPKIGSGLGGGNWSDIESIILTLLKDKDIEVNVYTGR